MDQVPSGSESLDPAVRCLFGVSLNLHGALDLLERDQQTQARQRIWSAVGQLDEAIAQIRDVAARLVTSEHGTENRAVAAFVAATGALVGGAELHEVLRPVLRCCVELLTVTAAGVILARPPTLLAAAPDQPEVAELLRLYRDGPGRTPPSRPQRLDPTAADWPEFAERAGSLGVTTVHTVPLRLREEVLGALVLPGSGLPRGTDGLVQSLADLAAVAIVHEHAARHREEFVTQLEFALTNQAIIEQAKGVLAERHGTSGSDAFTLMTVAARRRDCPVLEIARGVLNGKVDLGDEP
jgi:hypothetical protein